jgi:anti-sigma-K factor RskA
MAGYVLGNLSAKEAEELQQILENHPEMQAELDRLQSVSVMVPTSLFDAEPSSALKGKILTAAESRSSTADPPAATSSMPRSRSQRLYPVLLSMGGAVAAVLVMALALDNYRLRQEVQANQEIIAALQQPETRLYTLTGTENAANASGSLVINPTQQEVFAIVQNLPELPSEQVYRLWAIVADSPAPVYCGQFNTLPTGSVTTRWSVTDEVCSAEVSQLLITAESATAPPIPAGELVMESVL